MELCQEGERLCAAAVVSQVPERTWVKFTAALHSILEVLDDGVVINILGLDDISTSLRPKKQVQKHFAGARALLQEVLTTVPQAFDGLSEALIVVARSSAEYLKNRLAKTTKKIHKTKSVIDLLIRKQNEDIQLVKLLNQAVDETNKESEPLELGIITFYGLQVGLIRDRLDAIEPADKKT